jgi:hypothetical protein
MFVFAEVVGCGTEEGDSGESFVDGNCDLSSFGADFFESIALPFFTVFSILISP